ncbi:NifB/NifX family molybdenum-iron cluster-binding protein [Lentisphaerota bacterium WC36G]|nr:NifB/NifX family molybdenum-iron cluster-binding protein [Lentisphaerae bacterium WC36]
MKIAIPTVNDSLCRHFGHCEVFTIFEIENKKIVAQAQLTPPPHEPGVLPKWLNDMDVNMVIAGGMGARAQQLFAEKNIQVIVGAPAFSTDTIIDAYLNENLETGDNICDH